MRFYWQIFTLVCGLTCGLKTVSVWAQGSRASDDAATNSALLQTLESSDQERLVRITFLGAIAKPGVYELPENTRVIHALAIAGGPLLSANGDIQLERKGKIMSLDLQSALEDKSIKVAADDVYVLEQSFVTETQPYVSLSSAFLSLLTLIAVVVL